MQTGKEWTNSLHTYIYIYIKQKLDMDKMMIIKKNAQTMKYNIYYYKNIEKTFLRDSIIWIEQVKIISLMWETNFKLLEV